MERGLFCACFGVVVNPKFYSQGALLELVVAFCSELQYIIIKHKKIYPLTIAKLNSIRALGFKAVKDNKVLTKSFPSLLISFRNSMNSGSEYKATRNALLAPTTHYDQKKQTDLDKIKKEIRQEIKGKFQKKLATLNHDSK